MIDARLETLTPGEKITVRVTGNDIERTFAGLIGGKVCYLDTKKHVIAWVEPDCVVFPPAPKATPGVKYMNKRGEWRVGLITGELWSPAYDTPVAVPFTPDWLPVDGPETT